MKQPTFNNILLKPLDTEKQYALVTRPDEGSVRGLLYAFRYARVGLHKIRSLDGLVLERRQPRSFRMLTIANMASRSGPSEKA